MKKHIILKWLEVFFEISFNEYQAGDIELQGEKDVLKVPAFVNTAYEKKRRRK